MNIVLVYGKIISDIKFKFMISKKNDSATIFEIELNNRSTISIIAYDDLADKCYRQLENGENILIRGKLKNNKIELQDFEKIVTGT